MNYFQSAIIALALALNLLGAGIAGGIALKGAGSSRKVAFLGSMFFFQLTATGTGLWIGSRIGLFSSASNYTIALGIFMIMGLKVILDSLKTRTEGKVFDFTDNQVLIMFSLAEAITPLAVSIALGLISSQVAVPWMILSSFLLVAIFTGLILGSGSESSALKLRFGPVGGLILLAAALKLLLNLLGY
jgi:putative Mn2+ efflux pump MntP